MSDYNKDVFDPKAAAEARKAEMEGMFATVDNGLKEIFEGGKIREYLEFCARLPKYSVNNQLLIMNAKPDATMCQTFEKWKEAGRSVKKGEKGIRIISPVKDTKFFKPVSTFDIIQTEGDGVPSQGVSHLIDSSDNYAELRGIIKESFALESENENVQEMIREAAKQTLEARQSAKEGDSSKSDEQRVFETEAVTFIVCTNLGLGAAGIGIPSVLPWYEGKEPKELKGDLDVIRRSAGEVIGKIEDKYISQDVSLSVDQFVAEHGDEFPFDVPKPSVVDKLKEEKAKVDEVRPTDKVPVVDNKDVR